MVHNDGATPLRATSRAAARLTSLARRTCSVLWAEIPWTLTGPIQGYINELLIYYRPEDTCMAQHLKEDIQESISSAALTASTG